MFARISSFVPHLESFVQRVLPYQTTKAQGRTISRTPQPRCYGTAMLTITAASMHLQNKSTKNKDEGKSDEPATQSAVRPS